MSAPAQVTEAHRKLAQSIKLRWCSYDDAAQLIADSEARATAPLRARISSDEELFHEIRMKLTAACGDPYKLHDEALDAIIAERDRLRAEVKESKERERVAIASWDEERQRALREGERVEKLAGELAAAKAECERLHKAGTDTWRELRQQIHAKDAALARLRAAIDAAMKEGVK